MNNLETNLVAQQSEDNLDEFSAFQFNFKDDDLEMLSILLESEEDFNLPDNILASETVQHTAGESTSTSADEFIDEDLLNVALDLLNDCEEIDKLNSNEAVKSVEYDGYMNEEELYNELVGGDDENCQLINDLFTLIRPDESKKEVEEDEAATAAATATAESEPVKDRNTEEFGESCGSTKVLEKTPPDEESLVPASANEAVKFKCNDCDRSFTLCVALRRHIRKHHSNESESYKCELCTKNFQSSKLLVAHVKHHHHQEKKKCKTKKATSHANVCKLCNETFADGFSRLEHVLSVHRKLAFGAYCGVCGIWKRDKGAMVKHVGAEHEKPYRCECGKTFTDSSKLVEHAHLHQSNEEKKVLRCRKCNKEFADSVSIIEHIRFHMRQKNAPTSSSASSEEMYSCSVCCKTHNSYISLISHLRLHQSRERNVAYPCKYCDKLLQYGSLKQHLQTHISAGPTNLPPAPPPPDLPHLRCATCGKRFADNSTLILHMRSHVPEQTGRGVVGNRCSRCKDRQFASNDAYLKHLNWHTSKDSTKRFKCKLCDEVVSGRLAFVEHLRSKHLLGAGRRVSEKKSDERKHVTNLLRCKECDINFQNYVSFNEHVQWHKKRIPDRAKPRSAAATVVCSKAHKLKEINMFESQPARPAVKQSPKQQPPPPPLPPNKEPSLKVALPPAYEKNTQKRVHTINEKAFNRRKVKHATDVNRAKAEKKEIRCPYCDAIFPTDKLFTEHFKTHAEGRYRRELA